MGIIDSQRDRDGAVVWNPSMIASTRSQWLNEDEMERTRIAGSDDAYGSKS
jgi:hypothetical protein